MNILLTARWPVGGIRTYFRYIYTQEMFDRYRFTLVAPDIGLTSYIKGYFPSDRFRLVPSGHGSQDLLRSLKSEVSSGRHDLLHSHGFSSGALAWWANIGQGLPHVMTAHDVFRQEQFRGLRGKIKKAGLNLIYSRLDAVHTVGEDCRANFSEFMPLVRNSRINNIDHGVDVERFSSAKPRDFHGELNIPRTISLVGFFGRFMAQKGFIDLVNAMHHLSETLPDNEMPRVLTFGWGGFVREDFSTVQSLGVERYFYQLPFTDDVAGAIQGVDMVAMPSRWEACGLLGMEVLAAGKPLIATSCQGLRCVIEDSPVNPIAPRDSRALAEAILAQIEHGDQEFRRFQPIALKRFSLERPALEIMRLYNELAER